MATDEKIKHVTPLSGHKLGFFKQKQCYLTFTDQRIIVAYHDPQKVQEAYEQNLENHEEKSGKKAGFFKKIGARWNAHANFHKRFLEMNPEDILQGHADNFAIQPDSIARLVLKRGPVHRDDEGFESSSNDSLSIITKDNIKLNFTFVPKQFDSISHSLDMIIPEATFKRNKVILKR